MTESEFEREQEQDAAAEAAAIGGVTGDESYQEDGEDVDAAHLPLAEAGEGESEGFELAEQELIEHAGHGDQHAAGRILQDAPDEEAGFDRAVDAEADSERSSELDDDA